MASSAFSGIGTVFMLDSTAIAEVNSISGPNLSRDTIDVTSLDSTGGYREFIGGFRDGGEITLSCNFTEAGYIILKDSFELDTNDNFDLILDNGSANETQFTFVGLITALGMSVPMDDKITCDVTIKISGSVTVTS